jgi:hypothetical protein
MNSSPMIYPKKSAMRGTIKQEQSPSGAAKRRGASRTSRGVPVNDQEVTIRRQDEELIRLREQVRQLEQKNRKLSQKTVDLESNEQPLGLASKMFGGKRFDLQESGDNTGKYLQRVFEKVHCGGKYYEEWVVLEELKLSLKGWGSREGPTVQIGGIDFYKVKDGDHKGKFVQKVGPDSLCEFDGQKYIKWTIREQISDKSLRLNI